MGKHTVAVAGATGYAGGEMLRILAAHPWGSHWAPSSRIFPNWPT